MGAYKVRLLLPEELRTRQNIRIVFYYGDQVDVFNTVRDGNWIEFETAHFSDYYLVADPFEETINLWWLIILLLVVSAAETAVIILKRRHDAKTRSNAVGMLAVTVIPVGAYFIIAVLGVIALALAAYLVYLFLKKPKEPFVQSKDGKKERQSGRRNE